MSEFSPRLERTAGENGTHCEARVGEGRNGGLAVRKIGDKVSDMKDGNEVDVDSEQLERREDVARKVESANLVSTSPLLARKKNAPIVDASLGKISLVENEVESDHLRREHVLAQLRSRVAPILGRCDELIRKLLLLNRLEDIPLRKPSRRSSGGRRSVGIASESDDAVEGSGIHASVHDEGAEEGEDIGREEVETTTG